jgi:hypothetical protein
MLHPRTNVRNTGERARKTRTRCGAHKPPEYVGRVIPVHSKAKHYLLVDCAPRAHPTEEPCRVSSLVVDENYHGGQRLEKYPTYDVYDRTYLPPILSATP